MRKKTIAVISSSRADFGHLIWPLRAIEKHPELDYHLIGIGPHFSPQFGQTALEIERQGFKLSDRVESLLDSDSDTGMAKSIGLATLGLSDVLSRVRPDILLIIADRYEMLAPATVATALRIPIAHIEGGDISAGAIDDAVRNALTKLSHIHFVTTPQAAKRVISMGESAWRVHCVGSPSLDHLRHESLMPEQALNQKLGLTSATQRIVVVYHPVTMELDTLCEADEFFSALEQLPQQLIFCFPNADAGSSGLILRVQEFVENHSNAELFVNLPHHDYWSLLGCSHLLLGNSSSGIMESATLPIPAIDVGFRQKGRLRGANVISAEAETGAITDAVGRALSANFRKGIEGMTNPYGKGQAGEAIAKVLAATEVNHKLLVKNG